MRTLITELTAYFGTESNPIITEYINVQYQRIAKIHDSQFSLFDIEDENRLIRETFAFIKACDLSLAELVEHCIILPSVDSSQQNFIARFIVKPCLFKSMLSEHTQLSFSQVREGDNFECYTTDKHPLHTIKSKSDDVTIAAYLRGTTISTDQQFSCVFKKDEIIEVEKLLDTKLFPDVSVLSRCEINDVVYTALFLRFINDPSFFALKLIIPQEGYDKFEKIKAFFNSMFSDSNQNNVVYSSWGKPIATKVVRHTVDSPTSFSKKSNTAKIVKIASNTDDYLDGEKVADTWGKF